MTQYLLRHEIDGSHYFDAIHHAYDQRWDLAVNGNFVVGHKLASTMHVARCEIQHLE